MFEKIPTAVLMFAAVAVLLTGPVTVFAFLLAGPTAGLVTVLAIASLFTAFYIIAVRHYH